MNWSSYFMSIVDTIASKSKDQSRKIGAVIVSPANVILSTGWNGAPRGVEERHTRPIKYKYFEHAERNAIFNAARTGICLDGSTMYTNWFPCTNCARAIIQSGIKQLNCREPNFDHHHYGEDFRISADMLSEADISMRFYDDKR